MQKCIILHYIVVNSFSKVPTWNFYIENEIIASGEYETLSQANSGLLMEAYDDLKRYCFTLVKVGNCS